MNFKRLFDYSVPLVAASTILVVGALIAAYYFGTVLYSVKVAADVVEVTGSAKEAVVADMARWTINLETRTGVGDQQAGFTRLEAAADRITNYLNEQGFTEIETPSGSTYPTYTYPQYGEPIMTGYTVSRSITVRGSDVARISELSNNIEPFTGAGYNISTSALELTYSKLDEARVKLLSDAIADAKARAEAIAHDSDRSISTLRTASSGVVQVLPAGGIDISDYGTYDTQSMHKEVMVTVRATFSLD